MWSILNVCFAGNILCIKNLILNETFLEERIIFLLWISEWSILSKGEKQKQFQLTSSNDIISSLVAKSQNSYLHNTTCYEHVSLT